MVKDHITACGRLVAKAEFEVDKDSARSDCCARAEGYKQLESRASCCMYLTAI